MTTLSASIINKAMFEIKMTLLVLSRLYEILKSNENMTPEEYIKSKRHEDYPGGHWAYVKDLLPIP